MKALMHQIVEGKTFSADHHHTMVTFWRYTSIQLSLLLVSNPLFIIPGSNPNKKKNSLFHKLDVGAMLTLFCSCSFSGVKDMCCMSPEKVFYVTLDIEHGSERPQKGQGGSDSRS